MGKIERQELGSNLINELEGYKTHLAEYANRVPFINVKNPLYGAVGDNATDDTVALQSAFDAVPDNIGAVVIFPQGTYRYTSLTIKPKTKLYALTHEMATLRHQGTTPNVNSITVVTNPAGGEEGYIIAENITFQLGTRTYAGISCFASETYLAHCQFINCRFYRWTKYCINLTDSYTSVIHRCTFDTINGINGSGDIGTAIYSSDTANMTVITENVFNRCDRCVDISDVSRCDNFVIKYNDVELLGYTYDESLAVIDNPAFASYTAFALTRAVAVDISDNYFEGIRGNCIDLTEVKGYSVKCNFVEGEEPSNLGGSVVLDKFVNLTTCIGGEIANNAVYEYITSWITHNSPGTGLDSAIRGLDTNYIVDGDVQKFFPTGTTGTYQTQPPVAPTLLNSWANVGTGYQTAGYWRDSNGDVHLQGVISGGAGTTIMFALPSGYRPTLQERFLAPSDSATKYARVDVDASGNVTHMEGGTSQISLSGITFKAKVN